MLPFDLESKVIGTYFRWTNEKGLSSRGGATSWNGGGRNKIRLGFE